jgi:transcriptional regulator NrdR family protein
VSKAKNKPARGFVCPDCRVRLYVYYTSRPCAGRVVRYRQCPECGYRHTTEEHFGHVLKPKKK